MKMWINGEEKQYEEYDKMKLGKLVEILELKKESLAIEINEQIIPKKKYWDVNIEERDRIELVSFVGGG